MTQQDIINILYEGLINNKNVAALKIYHGGKALQVKTINKEEFNVMTVKLFKDYNGFGGLIGRK